VQETGKFHRLCLLPSAIVVVEFGEALAKRVRATLGIEGFPGDV
jgi:hypothetical protein